ncbi:E-selectin [Holothuria leucospilota]|uniref:E-selectin n=1 Tax=Holothuria leucospilota TaxID=206669 RepID=A0A9Q0YSX7_HOLLE|nr:E-selectin [Holothuria leucospilota]
MDSFFSKKILLDLFVSVILIALPAEAEIKGYFQCTNVKQEETTTALSAETETGGYFESTTGFSPAITCFSSNLPKVRNGTFNCSDNSEISTGGACNLTCEDGFYPAFSKQAVCETRADNQTGVWSEGNFSCRAVVCLASKLPVVSNGSFNCTPRFEISMGGACNLTCKDGFYPVSTDQAVCEEGEADQGGKWSDGNFTCRTIKCRDLPTVNFGFFNCSGYSDGDRCNLICNDSYYASSSNQTVCVEEDDFSGNWTDGNFTCSEIQCLNDDLPEVTNGSFDCPPGGVTMKDKVCNLTCGNKGLHPFPLNRAICVAGSGKNGGEWLPGNFSCRQFECTEWNEWSGNKYKLISTWQSWDQSRKTCADNAAHLVTIESKEDNEFVQKLAESCKTDPPNNADTWIGLRYNETEGKKY